ncbi:MAG TPA: GxxExxY protein [Terriglobales bacterium]|nr:GxxExxY protein [Terriglobales bacterium]
MGFGSAAARDPRTEEILGAAIEVHRELGPGLLESIHEECLCRELKSRGVPFQRQVPLPITYKGERLDCDYRVDLVAFDEVVMELKAVEALLPVHEAQLLSYMKLLHKRYGLLINFCVPALKDGIRRRIL